MKISEQYAGNYLKASDLPVPRAFTIRAVQQTQMPEGDTKPVMRFADQQQALVLNKTNAFICAEMFGDETEAWVGRQIELYSTTTSYGGRMVPCVRVRAPQTPHHSSPQTFQQLAPQSVPHAPPPQPQVEAPAAHYPVDA